MPMHGKFNALSTKLRSLNVHRIASQGQVNSISMLICFCQVGQMVNGMSAAPSLMQGPKNHHLPSYKPARSCTS